jgi:bifunctional non-homologous end joining protein LigD
VTTGARPTSTLSAGRSGLIRADFASSPSTFSTSRVANLRYRPLIERREWLAELVRGNPKIQFSEAFEGEAAAIFRVVERMGLEGIISKRADSRYRSGPSKAWLKTKCFVKSDFELLGVVREPGQAAQALMATPDRKHVGGAIVALKGAMRDRLWERVKTSPAPAPKGFKKAGAEWVQPGLVGRVRFLRGEGGLRHATLKEVREEG